MTSERTSPSPTPIGRLAPSPTGGLHVGHARTFLIAWLSARRDGGRVILRIEDLDGSRTREGAARAIVEDLRWLGLDWDEGPDVDGPHAPYLQSLRTDRYDAALARLIAGERVYPCTCTRADIARAASAPHAEDEGPTYPGTCAGRSSKDAEGLRADGRPFAWRFRIPESPVSWDDRFLGPTTRDPARSGGDFVVGRSSGEPAYQLAVVVDDVAMGVTQVVRGDDLIPSTPRQILIGRALGLEPPSFAHVPLAIGPDGRRLAKRDGSIKLATLRELGVDRHRLIGWLAASCGWSRRAERAPPSAWISRFDLAAIPAVSWVVDSDAIRGLLHGEASDPAASTGVDP